MVTLIGALPVLASTHGTWYLTCIATYFAGLAKAIGTLTFRSLDIALSPLYRSPPCLRLTRFIRRRRPLTFRLRTHR